MLPEARVLHSLLGGDVHIRWQRFVHKSPKSHAQVAGGAVHGLRQSLSKRPQAEEVIIHGVGEVHEVVEIHRVVVYLTHLYFEVLGVILEIGKEILTLIMQGPGGPCCNAETTTLFHYWSKKHSSPGLRVMWSFWGLIWVTSCVAPAALLLRGRFSITCSLLAGDSRADGAQPATTRLAVRSQRDERATPWPKSCFHRKAVRQQKPSH